MEGRRLIIRTLILPKSIAKFREGKRDKHVPTKKKYEQMS